MTSAKRLIVYGTLDLFTNNVLLVSQERFQPGLKVIFQIEDKGLFCLV